MTLAEELTWRGFINQTTFADINDINEPRTFYIGVDPSDDWQLGRHDAMPALHRSWTHATVACGRRNRDDWRPRR